MSKHEEGCACCNDPDFNWDDFFIAVHENVKKHLCHLNGIGAEVPFTYSTGLTKGEWPELILTGMHMNQAAGVIMAVVDMMKDDVLKIEHGKVVEIYEDCPVTFIKVSEKEKNERMGVTSRYLGGKPFDAYQIVWADRNQKFPWDEGFEEEFRINLPLLGEFDLA